MNHLQAMCTGEQQLVPGELRGYRMWRMDGRELHANNTYNGRWDVTTTATCRRNMFGLGSPAHSAPDPDCLCGIYGWYRPDSTRLHEGHIFGVVAASGRILLGDHGFRAERARIIAIVIDPTDVLAIYHGAASIWRERGVQVFESRDELVDAFPPEDVSELLGRPMPEDVPAAEFHLTTWRGRQLLSVNANGSMSMNLPPIPGSVAAELAALQQAVAQLAQAAQIEFEKAAQAINAVMRATGTSVAEMGRRATTAERMRAALERRKQGHRGPQPRRRGRARLEGTP